MVPDARLAPQQFITDTTGGRFGAKGRSSYLTDIDASLSLLDARWHGGLTDFDKASLLYVVVAACNRWLDRRKHYAHGKLNPIARKWEEKVYALRQPVVKAVRNEARGQWRLLVHDVTRKPEDGWVDPSFYTRKTVSAQTLARLRVATEAIQFANNDVFIYGAGNQKEDLDMTRGVANVRGMALRNPGNRQVTKTGTETLDEGSGAVKGADQARMSILARYWHAGACDDFSNVVFNYVRAHLAGVQVTRCVSDGLHHSYVIIGDFTNDPGNQLVVADPWPTYPQACTWRDFFGYRANRADVTVKAQMTADGVIGEDIHSHQVEVTTKKKSISKTTLSDGELVDLRQRLADQHDLWVHRYGTVGGKPIFYASAAWSHEEEAEELETFKSDLLQNRHLQNPKALKRLGMPVLEHGDD